MNIARHAVWIEGVGCLGPGLSSWADTQAVLRGEVPYTSAATVLPVPNLLPPAERRRASRVVKLALALGIEACAAAGAQAARLATVFTSSSGDGHNCHALCEQLASEDRLISPTRFHNSVHNAAAGYWGIATGAMAPSQVICAYDASFGAGLLDAMAQVIADRISVLLVAYDSEYPEPLRSKRPVPDAGGIALVLAPEAGERSLARIAIAPTRAAATRAGPALEALRTAMPALRALPLLQVLARRETGSVCLDYLPPMQLEIDVAPC